MEEPEEDDRRHNLEEGDEAVRLWGGQEDQREERSHAAVQHGRTDGHERAPGPLHPCALGSDRKVSDELV